MAESITSLLELKALQDALPDAQKPVLSLDDLLYVVHGLGSNRDTVWTLAEFIAFLVANEKFDELKLVKDSSNDITIKWDSTNSEFVIWERANTGTVAVPKLHVHGTLLVEKDTTIAADMVVTKSMTVNGRTELNGNFTVIKNLYSTDYAELHNRTKVERLNVVSEKSYFEVSTDSSVDTLLANTTISVTEGDVVIVRNTSGGLDITMTLGSYDSILNYVTTLKAYCSMAFIRTGVTGNGVKWSPLGNSEVTVE